MPRPLAAECCSAPAARPPELAVGVRSLDEAGPGDEQSSDKADVLLGFQENPAEALPQQVRLALDRECQAMQEVIARSFARCTKIYLDQFVLHKHSADCEQEGTHAVHVSAQAPQAYLGAKTLTHANTYETIGTACTENRQKVVVSEDPISDFPATNGFFQAFKSATFLPRRDNDRNTLPEIEARLSLGHKKQWGVLSPVVDRVMTFSGDVQPNKEEGCLASFIEGTPFKLVCGLAIMCNCTMTFAEIEVSATTLTEPAGGDTGSIGFVFEVLFLVWYFIELVLKLSVHGCYLFAMPGAAWNMFDAALLVTGALNILATLFQHLSIGNVMVLRALRIVKITRVFRVCTALKFITDLRLMLDTISGCFWSLFWSFTLLAFVAAIFSAFFVQSVTMYLITFGDSISEEDFANYRLSYGCLQSAMISLFKCMFGGEDWGAHYELIARTGTICAGMFMVFIIFSLVAVMNIVVSIFINRVSEKAQPDNDNIMLKKAQRDYDDAVQLVDLCRALIRSHDESDDEDEEGEMISKQQLFGLLEEVEVREYFEARNMDIKDVDMFFRMLLASEGHIQPGGALATVKLDTFVSSVLNLNGPATSVDLQTVKYEVEEMARRQTRFSDKCNKQFTQILEQLAKQNASRRHY